MKIKAICLGAKLLSSLVETKYNEQLQWKWQNALRNRQYFVSGFFIALFYFICLFFWKNVKVLRKQKVH